MRRAVPAVVAALALSAAACAGGVGTTVTSGAPVRGLGETFTTSRGEVYLLRVQDEYRMIRCIPTGPIAGCYQDVFKVARDAITDETRGDAPYRWNQWIPVAEMPGVEVMFLTPERVSVRDVGARR